jgi:hypothetical protein
MDDEHRRAADVLLQWREVERAMEDPAVGQAGLEGLQAEAARLRDEYQRLVDSANGTNGRDSLPAATSPSVAP